METCIEMLYKSTLVMPNAMLQTYIIHVPLAATSDTEYIVYYVTEKLSKWNKGTMCKDRRFYRHLWVRFVV